MQTISKERREYIRQWGITNRVRKLATIGAWKKNNPARVKASNQKSDAQTKNEVLSHYGKLGHAICCWENCFIADLDMLTLDHIDNSGARDRSVNGMRRYGMTGIAKYRKIRLEGWPPGYQTLCWNHQWKKELLRRKTEGSSSRRAS